MTARATLITVLLTPFLLYGALLALYVTRPALLHFRAWEMFDIFTARGFHERAVVLDESGDSSRDYLFQRYIPRNAVSVNDLGNRIACYDPNGSSPRVLALGDSQMFGSGSDDKDTLPAQLCARYGANIYNGARRNGRDLLRTEGFTFDSVIFTASEYYPMTGTFCHDLEHFTDVLDHKLPRSALMLPQPTRQSARETLAAANLYLQGLLASRLSAALRGPLRGMTAPNTHLIKFPYRHHPIEDVVAGEVACAKSLAALFEPRGVRVGFFYFPTHQTMHGPQSGLAVDPGTLEFISRVTAGLTAAGLRTLDTRQCLQRAAEKEEVYLLHDTHLSPAGFKAIAQCLTQSDLASLIVPPKR